MSQILDYMVSTVRSYLDREIDIDEFRQSFAGAHVYARNSPQDKEANQLANKLMPPIAEFSGGHRSEQSLRDAMRSETVVLHHT